MKMMVHASRHAGTRVVPDDGTPCFCPLYRCRACANPPSVLLAAFSRPLFRCYPLSYRPPLLCLLCADETSSAQWTICVPSLLLQTLRGEDARKGRCAGGTTRIRELSCCQDIIVPLSWEQYLYS